MTDINQQTQAGTHNARLSPSLSPETRQQAVWLIEIMDSDGNDGTYEVEAATEKAARRAAFAEHDSACGNGAYAWIVSCEEQE